MIAWSEFKAGDGLTIRVVAGPRGIRRLDFHPSSSPAGDRDPNHPLIVETMRQVREYFAGDRREFALPLDLEGTEFQRRVWGMLETIPYGETRSYRWLAAAADRPRGYQAVGQANGSNPVSIIVPCHRVIASDGSLCGYAGGLDVKRALLQLEAMHAGFFLQATT